VVAVSLVFSPLVRVSLLETRVRNQGKVQPPNSLLCPNWEVWWLPVKNPEFLADVLIRDLGAT
jgi:hypothetical protein